MCGPERANQESDPRTMLDVAATWKPNDCVTVGWNGDYGSERGAVDPGRTATWSGVAGYARAALTSALAVIVRVEYFADPGGARTGVPQSPLVGSPGHPRPPPPATIAASVTR